MNGEAFILDSNFILDYLKNHPAHAAFMKTHESHSLAISVITELELFSFSGMIPEEEEIIKGLLDSIEIVPLDDSVKNAAVAFRRHTRCKLPDSIIAATAISRNCPLITNDGELLKTAFAGFVARQCR